MKATDTFGVCETLSYEHLFHDDMVIPLADVQSLDDLKYLSSLGFRLQIQEGEITISVDNDKLSSGELLAEDILEFRVYDNKDLMDYINYKQLTVRDIAIDSYEIWGEHSFASYWQIYHCLLDMYQLDEDEKKQLDEREREYADERRHPDEKKHAGEKLLKKE